MKNARKILMAALAVALVGGIAVLPQTAGFIGTSVTVHAASTYTFEDGVLTISGSGTMERIYDSTIQTTAKEVIIGEGITTISNGAFYGFSALKKATLPSTLTRISSSAFMNTGLEEITIPAGVTYVDSGAFYGNTSLKKATFKGVPTNLYPAIFQNCTALEEIVFEVYSPIAFTNSQRNFFYSLPDNVTIVLPAGSNYNGNEITEEYIKNTFRSTVKVRTTDNRGANVSFDVDPAFTVTIPDKVDLADTDVTAAITGQDILLENDKHVVVSLTDAANTVNDTEFTVKTAEGAEANYQIKKDDTALKLNDEIVRFVYDGTENTFSQQLTFTAPTNVSYAGTYRDTLTFTVAVETPVHVTGVTLDRTSVTTSYGQTVQLAATVNPDNATFPTVTWTSSKEDVATVDHNGNITTTGTGYTTIKATADGKSATCTVKVLPAETNQYNKDSDGIGEGIVLSFGDTVDTTGTSKRIKVIGTMPLETPAGNTAYWYENYDQGEIKFDMNSFEADENKLLLHSEYGTYQYAAGANKAFKIKYDADLNRWFIEQVDKT